MKKRLSFRFEDGSAIGITFTFDPETETLSAPMQENFMLFLETTFQKRTDCKVLITEAE